MNAIQSTSSLMSYITIDPAVITISTYSKLSPEVEGYERGARRVEFSLSDILQDDAAKASATSSKSNGVVRKLVNFAESSIKETIRDPGTKASRVMCEHISILQLFEKLQGHATAELTSLFKHKKMAKPTENGTDADKMFIRFALDHIKVKDNKGMSIRPAACESTSVHVRQDASN